MATKRIVLNRAVFFSLAAAALGACGGRSPAPAAPAQADPKPAAVAGTPSGTTAPAAPTPTPPEFRLPTTVAPTEYAVELTLDPDAAVLEGLVTVQVHVSEPTDVLWLNGKDLTLGDAVVTQSGRTIAARAIDESNDDFVGLQLAEKLAAGDAAVRIAYTGKVSDSDMSGVFRQKDGERWYLYTQFEAIDARRAFPCFDEPHFKTPWQLTIRVKPGQNAFANTAEISQANDGEWVVHTFERTRPIPSYLVAFAAGPFEIVDAGTGGRNSTPIRIIVPAGRSGEAGYAVEATAEILERLENYFDLAYPYPKLDGIAVPRFFGAMENPGLITYAMASILAAPEDQTDGFKEGYASVAAHEIAHQWFGDLVTMKWWDDLWLNESFATWLGSKIVNEWHPEWAGEVFAVSQREQAMAVDGQRGTKPIRQKVSGRVDLFGGASAIVYAKGSAVLGTFEAWIGADKFRDGIRQYIRDHAWGNAAADDFFAALAGVSSPELASAFSTFIDQPGYPLVSATLICESGASPRVELTQERYNQAGAGPAEAGMWQVPLCVRYGDRKGQRGSECTLLKEDRAELALTRIEGCPSWAVANTSGVGYYRVNYTGDLLQRNLLGPGHKHVALPERVAMIGDASALVSAGKLEPADTFQMVPGLLTDLTPQVVTSTIEIVSSVDAYLVPPDLRANYQRFIRKTYGKQARKLGWTKRRGEDREVADMRPELIRLVANLGEDPALIAEAQKRASDWIKDPKSIDESMVSAVLSIAARHSDATIYEQLYQRARTTEDRRERGRLLRALAAVRDPELVRKNFQLLLGEEFDMREAAVLMQAPLRDPRTREVAYSFIKDNYDAILAKLPPMFARFMVLIAAVHCDDAHAADARAFFEPRVENMAGGKEALEQAVEQIAVCSAQRTRQQPSVESFLKKY